MRETKTWVGLWKLKRKRWTRRSGRSRLSVRHSQGPRAPGTPPPSPSGPSHPLRVRRCPPHPSVLPSPTPPKFTGRKVSLVGLLFKAAESSLERDQFLRQKLAYTHSPQQTRSAEARETQRSRPGCWLRPRPGPDARGNRPPWGRRGWRGRSLYLLAAFAGGLDFTRYLHLPSAERPLRPGEGTGRGGNGPLAGFEAQPTTEQEEARPSFKGLRETGAAGQSLAPPTGIRLRRDLGTSRRALGALTLGPRVVCVVPRDLTEIYFPCGLLFWEGGLWVFWGKPRDKSPFGEKQPFRKNASSLLDLGDV